MNAKGERQSRAVKSLKAIGGQQRSVGHVGEVSGGVAEGDN
jgi:hypothetical protein